jgi:outer membrane protein assembly factor BamB
VPSTKSAPQAHRAKSAAAGGTERAAGAPSAPAGRITGWLSWRGPHQNGTSDEKGLPETWKSGGANHRWEMALAGRGTPVIANGRLYTLGYRGEGPDLQEVLVCADAETGRRLWERRFSDFLSDTIYDRYSLGSPAVDPETGNVYVLTSPGIFACFAPDGRQLWQHSMMEEWGRLTFPNGRTGSPLVDDDLVIIRGITGNWGAHGAAADRFYAFDKKSGELVWVSTPGDRPHDNSWSLPVLAWERGKRVFYTGDGSGSLVCANARTGEPIWRYPISSAGINVSSVIHKGKVITLHDAENLDSSESGRMVAVRTGASPKPGEAGPVVLDQSAEAWRNPISCFSSSPVLVGDVIYQVGKTGVLYAVDANTGRILWEKKLGPDQLHASPLYADGKLYIPIQNGMFFILRPTATGVKELARVQLAGNALGAPAVWNGKVYVHTTQRLYCFGRKGTAGAGATAQVAASRAPRVSRPAAGAPVALQIIPAEVLLRPGQKMRFTVRGIDANGMPTGVYPPDRVKWASYIPPTARVRSEMNASFNAQGELVAANSPEPSAGAFEATVDGLKGTFRGRVLPHLPLSEDFESATVDVAHQTESGVKFSYPPLPWMGARFRWEIRDVGGAKVLAKTLDNNFFQRAQTFIGHPDMSSYTIEADVMSDGNRRNISTVGIINQRYLISLLGNAQQLEVSSNQERMKVAVPFAWAPKVWYRLKARVDLAADGSGVVRAKAWKRGETEPEAWTIEAPHQRAHANGAPGIFGFAPQSQFRVYVDNISVTSNQETNR